MLDINEWGCEKHDKIFRTKDEFLDHLKTHHGIESTSGLKGTRQMIAHMDGADWYSSAYMWTIGEEVFYQNVNKKRAKEDKRFWLGNP